MNSKELILSALRDVIKSEDARFERPDLSGLAASALRFEDPFSAFCTAVKTAGGQVVQKPVDKSIDDLIKELYPDAARIASTLEGCSGFDPDEVAAPAELNGTDVAIVRGEFGVAENGAVWLQQNFRHRALLFIAEALVIVLDSPEVVNNMHEAYARLGEVPTGYGIFISGPSKTADIEQALVFGAHGARSLTVIVRN